ncbi:MAG: thioesterase family protein [Phycisphaeraceae bacterium]
MIEPPVANPFVLPITVRETEIDLQGHASNVAILGWMNRAAWEHSKAMGWDIPQYQQLAGWFVVRRHEIDYRSQAMLGDELLAYTWPSDLAKATAERRHRIVRPADGRIVAEGFNVWAFVDAETTRPKRIPPELRAAFDPARFL